MTLITRISRLFKADMHSILDAIEDPQAVLSQAVRDMRESILRDEARLAEIAAHRHETEERRLEAERAVADLRDQTELCLKSGNDTLARAVVRKRLEHERTIVTLKKHFEALCREQEGLSAMLKKKREKLEEILERASLFQSAASTISDEDDPARPEHGIQDTDVEVALLAEKERVLGSSKTAAPQGGAT